MYELWQWWMLWTATLVRLCCAIWYECCAGRCFNMLCYEVVFCAMFVPVRNADVMLCYTVPYLALPCAAMLWYTDIHNDTLLCCATSRLPLLRHAKLCNFMSCYRVWFVMVCSAIVCYAMFGSLMICSAPSRYVGDYVVLGWHRSSLIRSNLWPRTKPLSKKLLRAWSLSLKTPILRPKHSLKNPANVPTQVSLNP